MPQAHFKNLLKEVRAVWHKNLTSYSMKTKTDQKKEEVSKRAEKLDPNNNTNLPEKPLVKRRGKKVHDDNFEHRSSGETASL